MNRGNVNLKICTIHEYDSHFAPLKALKPTENVEFAFKSKPKFNWRENEVIAVIMFFIVFVVSKIMELLFGIDISYFVYT